MKKKRPRLYRRDLETYRNLLNLSKNSYFSESAGKIISRTPFQRRNDACLAYYFATVWGGRDIDFARLQNIIVKSNYPKLIYKYARDVPGANIRKLQYAMLRTGNTLDLKKFSRLPGVDTLLFEKAITIREVMEA